LYHYGLAKGFFQGLNDNDEIYLSIAQSHPLPRDGKVRRILDIGCGTGQVTTAVKERFPDAEVWGIDVAGPMARYAHHRASTMGVDVKFAQRLAEDTGFPSNHFDLVFDHIVFHEVTADAAKKIVEETNRVLRPGGVFHHLDIGTKGNPHAHMPKTVMEKGFYWMGHRLNIEPWFWVYMGSDFPRVMRERGFQVDLSVAANRSGIYPGVMGTKV
jgi:ubiquinone/menaquinone biosynthesis C-methylase UbiE